MKNEEKELASEKQVQLILALDKELGRRPSMKYETLTKLTKESAANFIDELKKIKNTQNGYKNVVNGQNGFNDAAFGMVYKIVSKEWETNGYWNRLEESVFIQNVVDAYLRYNKARALAKAKIAESGQK